MTVASPRAAGAEAGAGAKAGERFDAVEGGPGEIEAVRRERDADRVENEMAGADPDLAGDLLVTLPARKLGQSRCDMARNRFNPGSGDRPPGRAHWSIMHRYCASKSNPPSTSL